jgi:glutathione reductase (NADPH)
VPTYDFDLFTIGAGSGGVRASRMAAAKGARVAVAEMGALGGTCVNLGCIPKKLFVYAAQYAHAFEDALAYGWRAPEPTFDWATLVANKDAEIRRLNSVYARILRGAGAELVAGRARLAGEHEIEVTAADGTVTRHTAEHVLVATGGRPVRPTEPGTDRAWVSDDVFGLETLPKRILVVGAGYIALEMAGIFHGLGTQVTLVYRGPHVLRGFDDDARAFLTDEIRKTGIDVRLNTTVRCLEDAEGGAISAVLSHDEVVEVDAALYAIGRTPNTDGLGLEARGVELDSGGRVVVDDYYRSSIPWIHAIGDVANDMNLTPVALAEGMALAETLFGEGPTRVDYDYVPTAVFSQPPLATVGLTEAAARAAHGPVDVYTSEFRPLKHTLSGRSERTFVKMIVHPETDRVLGVHLVGADGPEIIQAVAVALRCEATKAQFDATIGLHPTAAEELVTLRDKRPD